MCGIVGLVDLQSSVNPRIIRVAADLLYKRGPDDAEIWVEQNIGLGHTRLAVVDPSPAARQPMISEDDRYVITFNGEIYNFLELRRRLSGSDCEWTSHSDTEVILAAYAKWGVDCLKYFHGMFGFAIWDRQAKVLFAARDRMGVKPFYYHYSSDCLAFASRPRALWPLCPKLGKGVDEQALRYYFEAGYIPAPFSVNRDVQKLAPAHYMLWDGAELRITRYWDFSQITPEESWANRREDDLLDELDEIASRVVRWRMISDVPLGAFLSGGIDSSLIVALMARHSSSPVKTFTIGFEERKYDESVHANAVSDYVGTAHYCEKLKVDDLLRLMPTFREEFDEPFFDSSAIPAMAVCKLARKHVTVALSGEGGDELFGGYHYYTIAGQLAHFYKLPKVLRGLTSSLAGLIPGHRIKLFAAALQQMDSLGAFTFARSIAKDFPAILNPDIYQRTQGLRELFAVTSDVFPRGLTASEQGMRLDALFTLADDYLQKVDVASMAFSLESREPLLDQELIEWGMRLPLKWKLRGGQNKYLLRQLAYRYIPQKILDRPKQGFEVPIDRWLRGPLKDWALERIESPELYQDSPLNQSRVRKLFDLHISGQRNVHPLLWASLMYLDFTAAQSLFVRQNQAAWGQSSA